MFTHMKLRWRLLASYLVSLLLFFVMIGLSWIRWSEAETLSEELNSNAHISQEVATLSENILRMQRATYAYVLSGIKETDESVYSKTVYTQNRASAYDMLEKLNKSNTADKVLEGIQKFNALLPSADQSLASLIKLVDQGREVEAINLFHNGGIMTQSRQFDQIADRIIDEDAKERSSMRNNITASIQNTKHWVLYGSLTTGLILVAFGFWISLTLSRDIYAQSNQIASSAIEIASTMNQYEQTVLQQTSAVIETTTTVEEIVASSRISAEQAEASAKSAKSVQEKTLKGMQIAEFNQKEMAELEKRISTIAEQIIRLSEQAAQIGNISSLVSELSGETNMLALNAAVEAARAGEHGKGFSVVAVEIRKLADQSKQSAEKSNQIVADIQKATNTIVMATEAGSKTTRDVAESVRNTFESFGAVSRLADGLYQNAQQVLLNSRQQVAALSQIDLAMKNIKLGAEEMSAGTKVSRDGVINLTQIANRLKQTV